MRVEPHFQTQQTTSGADIRFLGNFSCQALPAVGNVEAGVAILATMGITDELLTFERHMGVDQKHGAPQMDEVM